MERNSVFPANLFHGQMDPGMAASIHDDHPRHAYVQKGIQVTGNLTREHQDIRIQFL
jgi:hypothetical protein